MNKELFYIILADTILFWISFIMLLAFDKMMYFWLMFAVFGCSFAFIGVYTGMIKNVNPEVICANGSPATFKDGMYQC